ncbi:MAG TPA: hypothetical protein VMZ27_18575 [Candidatus Saccharimonadales bacterium]|nr:hypothetical protein [Candidatus Saccharimonadales bacterium]
MVLVDLILNLAALLLWLNWRELRLARREKPGSASFAGLLKYTGKRRRREWWFLVLVVAVLLARAMIFQQIGPSLRWTPILKLDLVTLPFLSDLPGRMLAYSVLSFLVLMGKFYLLLLFLSFMNRNSLDPDPIQKWVRLQIGWLERMPVWFSIILILAATVAAWFFVTPLLRHLNITPSAHTHLRTAAEGLLLGLSALLVWKYLIIVILALAFANSFVYFGASPLWHCISVTSQNLLKPFRFIPLQFGRFDLRPLLLIAIVAVVGWACRAGLERLYPQLPKWF